MKKLKVFTLIAIFFVSSFGLSLFRIQSAMAFDYSELTPIPSPATISSAISIKVLTKARIEVTVNVGIPVFNTSRMSTATFNQAFSGIYIDNDPTDGNVEFTYTNPKPWGENDKDDFRGRIYISKSDGSPKGAPIPNTPTEVASYLSQSSFELSMGVRDDLPGGNTDKTFFFSDEGDSNGSGTYDWNELDGRHTFVIFPQSAFSDSSHLAALYYMQDRTLIKDGNQTTSYVLCPLEGYAVSFAFKEGGCDYSGGGEFITDPAWTNITEDQIYQQLSETGPSVLYKTLNNTTADYQVGVIGSLNDIKDYSGAAGGPGESNCETEGGAFSFILCPALEYANDAIGWLDDRIINSLRINSAYYTDPSIKDAWGNIRNVAYLLLVPILLFMVIGTALQLSFLDAYTVKRAMPRLFVAVIFIALSYDVTKIMIEVTNGVGRGIGGLIASPFGGYSELTLQNIFTAPQGGGNVLWGGILAGVAVASLFVVSIGILFSYLFVAALALLIIFILLSIRELLIIFLLIMSPLAILSWIFPSNDKLWKLWWSTFTKLLYIFPIIMALLTSGRAFAYLIKETPTDENAIVLTIVKLTAFIGPYFFIPKAFQMAGGAFATLAGMANDRGKGLFDRQRKYRGESRKNRLARISSNRPRSKNTITRGMYAAGSAMLSQVDAVKKDGVRRGLLSGAAGDSRRAAEKRQRDEERQHAEKDPTLQQNIGNDQFGEVILQLIDNPGVSDESLMKYLQAHNYSETGAIELISSARSLHSDYGHALAGTALMGKVGSNTSYTGGEDQLLDDIIRAGHGSEADMMALLGQARATAANKGLFHLSGGSYGEDSAMLQALLRVKKNGGAPLAEDIEYTDEITGERGVLQTAGLDESAVRELINNRKEEKARASMQSWDFSRIHATSARKLAGSLHQEVQRMSTDASSETDPGLRAQKMRALGQKIAQVRSIQTSISQSSSQEVKEIFADALDNADGSQPALNVGGDSYSSLSELVSIPTQIHGDMEDFVKTNGETLGPRDAQTVNDLRSLSGGYRSTTQSPYDGMSEAQRRAMMDQQNGPNG